MATSLSSRPTRGEIRQKLQTIRRGIRITKITCTRSVKGRTGDSFVGFSAAWQAVQDEADHVDLGEESAAASQGISIKDARLARYMLALECDVAALESAYANGSITQEYFRDAVRGVRHNYNQLILNEMGATPDDVEDRGHENR